MIKNCVCHCKNNKSAYNIFNYINFLIILNMHYMIYLNDNYVLFLMIRIL